MATRFLVNLPVLPKQSIKPILPPRVSHPTHEQYSTPRTSAQTNQVPSDSESTITDHSSAEITDTESSHSSFVGSPKSRTEIQFKLKNDEVEFFAYSPSKSPRRKRDRVRAAFSRKFSRSESTTGSEASTDEWNTTFGKAFLSMQNDVQKIIAGLDEIDRASLEDTEIEPTGIDRIRPHLTFHERQHEKLQLMRLAEMLHPPDLLTYETKECPYAYTDLVAPHNFKHLRATKGVPDEHLYVQCKPIQHRKCHYRTQRGLLRMRKDLKKIRRETRGTKSNKSSPQIPSHDVINYRIRLEKTLADFRRQMKGSNHNDNPCETMTNTTDKHSKTKMQMEEYQMKSKTLVKPSFSIDRLGMCSFRMVWIRVN